MSSPKVRVQGLCKVFGTNPKQALDMLAAGATKDEEPALSLSKGRTTNGKSDQEDQPSVLGPSSVVIKVRAALHTGAAQERDGDYFGPPVNRVARLLHQRLGTGGFWKNRLQRIALPLVIGWVVLYPLIVWIWIAGIGKSFGGAPPPMPETPRASGAFPLAHLWFLYQLLQLYAIALLVRAVVARVDRDLAHRLLDVNLFSLENLREMAVADHQRASQITLPISQL